MPSKERISYERVGEGSLEPTLYSGRVYREAAKRSKSPQLALPETGTITNRELNRKTMKIGGDRQMHLISTNTVILGNQLPLLRYLIFQIRKIQKTHTTNFKINY